MESDPINCAGTKNEQFEKVNRYYVGAGCGNQNAKLPALKARYATLVKLAESTAEKEICDNLLFSIESIEFGKKSAEEKDMQRRQNGAKVIGK